MCPKKFPEALLRCYHQSNSGLPTSVKEVPTLEERGHVTQPWYPMCPLRPQASKGEASRTADLLAPQARLHPMLCRAFQLETTSSIFCLYRFKPCALKKLHLHWSRSSRKAWTWKQVRLSCPRWKCFIVIQCDFACNPKLCLEGRIFWGLFAQLRLGQAKDAPKALTVRLVARLRKHSCKGPVSLPIAAITCENSW